MHVSLCTLPLSLSHAPCCLWLRCVHVWARLNPKPETMPIHPPAIDRSALHVCASATLFLRNRHTIYLSNSATDFFVDPSLAQVHACVGLGLGSVV